MSLIEISVKVQPDASVNDKLNEINWRLKKMSEQLDRLTNEVSENREVIGSAIVLIQGIKTRLDEAIASQDPAALEALAADLDTQTASLAQAVADNTVASVPDETPSEPV
jgi:dynactin complex subunit